METSTPARPRRPIRESRRLRILITHRENMIARRQAEVDALRADKRVLEDQLAKVVQIEAAAVGSMGGSINGHVQTGH